MGFRGVSLGPRGTQTQEQRNLTGGSREQRDVPCSPSTEWRVSLPVQRQRPHRTPDWLMKKMGLDCEEVQDKSGNDTS